MQHRGTESNGRLAKAMQHSHGGHAIHGRVLDRGIRHSRGSRFGSVPSECPRHEEPAGTQNRRAGESVVDETAHLWVVAKFIPAIAGDPHDADVLAAAE